jgi:hypothetical protein
MLVRPLTTNERAETPGFTHVARITADDLTNATAAAAQTIDLTVLFKNDIILRVAGYIRVPFQNTLDGAFNTTTVSIGDTSGVAALAAAGEANANAATPVNTLGVVLTGGKIYTAADTLRVTFNSMAGKALVNLNRGEYFVFFALSRLSEVANAMAAARISKT